MYMWNFSTTAGCPVGLGKNGWFTEGAGLPRFNNN